MSTDLGRRMDIAASTADMQWSCERPGLWNGTNGVNTASAHKVREGGLHSTGWMWVTRVNGEYLTNADSLAHAKVCVAEHLRTMRRQWLQELS